MAIINGNSLANILDGTAVADRIDARGGNDTVSAGGGDDVVYAGEGSDVVFGGAGNDYIEGDTILVADTGGNDSLYGDAGNDTIIGMGGSDWIEGGEGDDLLVATSNNSSYGYLPSDFNTLFGDSGNDIASFSFGNRGTFDGGEGNDSIELFASEAPGSDLTLTTAGGSGSLVIDGETFVTWTSVENVRILAIDSIDHIQTGAGDDYLDIGSGADVVDAGAGNDTISYTLGDANQLAGGDGTDMLIINGLDSFVGGIQLDLRDRVEINDGFGSIITGFEAVTIFATSTQDVIVGWAGDDVLDGGGGPDMLHGWHGNDILRGGDENDLLRGGQGDDTLDGGKGNDRLHGGGDSDLLEGGNGRDTLRGGSGDDQIIGELGADQLTGGSGADEFIFGDLSQVGVDHITDFENGIDTIVIESRFWADLGLEAGALDPSLFSISAPVGDHGQFVLLNVDGTTPVLVWDSDGTGAIAGQAMIKFSAGVALDAGDFLII